MSGSFARRMVVGATALVSVVAIGGITTPAQERPHRPQPGTTLSEEQIKQVAAPMRAGRKLTPVSWPNGDKVAVCLSWDVDDETFDIASGNTAPVELSEQEYGATEGLPHILALYDKYNISGSFYVPAVTAVLHPEVPQQIMKSGRHEIGIHGWIHESLTDLDNEAEESRLLNQAIAFWTKAIGRKPVGYRAPAWAFSKYTLALIRKAGFEYDSSAMGMDEPYELVSEGKPTGMVELPVEWILDDYPYFTSTGALPSPELIFKVYQDEFDQAYAAGTMFMLTMHPQISGHRSRLMYLEKLVQHMKTKPGVWFATGQQIADYVRQQSKMTQ